MKIFFTHASAGAGHQKAAEAAYHYFREHCKNNDLRLVDVLDKTSPLLKAFYCLGYPLLVSHMTWLWRFCFWLTYTPCLRPPIRAIWLLLDRINTARFAEFIIKENPDYILSTHFLTSEICAFLKRKKLITGKLITIITDFGVHPFWLSPGTDVYCVASGYTKKELIRLGVRETEIREFGIPLDPKFLKPYDRDALFNKFKLNPAKFTVLIMTGSFGIGPIEDIVEILRNEVQILVVCASNKKLYYRLRDKGYPEVKVFGFVDNVQELMAVAQAIITKPGGLTITEVLAMELAPIFISAIPGQEINNLAALKSYGVGVSAHTPREAEKIILDYKDNPDKLKKLKEKIRNIRKPGSLVELCREVCQDCIRPSG